MASLAKAAAEAIRVDFRNDKTREYYGRISLDGDTPLTAITICDPGHFSVEDEDRLLDGTFTVLGKVTSGLKRDVPILQRNKVLDRLNPVFVDGILETLKFSASAGVRRAPGVAQASAADPFSLAIPSRISGDSFQVIPIAIYA